MLIANLYLSILCSVKETTVTVLTVEEPVAQTNSVPEAASTTTSAPTASAATPTTANATAASVNNDAFGQAPYLKQQQEPAYQQPAAAPQPQQQQPQPQSQPQPQQPQPQPPQQTAQPQQPQPQQVPQQQPQIPQQPQQQPQVPQQQQQFGMDHLTSAYSSYLPNQPPTGASGFGMNPMGNLPDYGIYGTEAQRAAAMVCIL